MTAIYSLWDNVPIKEQRGVPSGMYFRKSPGFCHRCGKPVKANTPVIVLTALYKGSRPRVGYAHVECCQAELEGSLIVEKDINILSKALLPENCFHEYSSRGGRFGGHSYWDLFPKHSAVLAVCNPNLPEGQLTAILLKEKEYPTGLIPIVKALAKRRLKDKK